MKEEHKPHLIRRTAFFLIFAILLTGCAHSASEGRATLSQVSTIQALMQGVYAGDTTIAELSTLGDFGIGTFDALDGEMLAVDGHFYQISADGSVREAPGTLKTPFAAVHFFHSRQRVTVSEEVKDYEQLKKILDRQVHGTNRPYAFKVTGVFNYIKTRSVPRQTRPYPPLTEAVKRQSVFEFEKIRGTLVGYKLPGYMDRLNVPGYHLHFISEDKEHGGHLLECRLSQAVVEVDYIYSISLSIPQNADFQGADLGEHKNEELDRVEKSSK